MGTEVFTSDGICFKKLDEEFTVESLPCESIPFNTSRFAPIIDTTILPVKMLSESTTIPTYAHEGDAGMDLYAAEDVTIPCGETRKIPTDIAMAIPQNLVGLIYARSGLATKQGLRPANCTGVVDSGYRGNIIVALHNDSAEPRDIKAGDRIAQMILTPFVSGNILVVDELDDTERSTGGFGSSGAR